VKDPLTKQKILMHMIFNFFAVLILEVHNVGAAILRQEVRVPNASRIKQ